jgi:hypothetical protein
VRKIFPRIREFFPDTSEIIPSAVAATKMINWERRGSARCRSALPIIEIAVVQ